MTIDTTNPSTTHSKNLIKGRNQCLRQPEAKHQLRPRHEQLWRQSLKEAGNALVLHHAAYNPES